MSKTTHIATGTEWDAVDREMATLPPEVRAMMPTVERFMAQIRVARIAELARLAKLKEKETP